MLTDQMKAEGWVEHRGETRPDWKPIPGVLDERLKRQQLGWDDYHNMGRSL